MKRGEGVGGVKTLNVEFTYDAENQPTAISYRYDGLGRRIEKNVNGQITRYIYDNEDILCEYDGTNTLVARYTHGARIDEPISMERNGQTYFYHTDGLGSIRQLSNSTGQVVESYTYSSFGLPTILDHSLLPTPHSLLGNPYTFTGREYDSESGLYYYRARYYDPRIGRFISKDILNDLNRYLYCANDPVSYADPWGLLEFAPGDEGGFLPRIGEKRDWWHPIAHPVEFYNRADLLRRWGHLAFPREIGSPFRHYFVSYILTQEYGPGWTRAAGIGNEIQGFLWYDIWNLPSRIRGNSPWAFQWKDLLANEAGIQDALRELEQTLRSPWMGEPQKLSP